MTRREEIEKYFTEKYSHPNRTANGAWGYFLEGALWADKNPMYHQGSAIETALMNENNLKAQIAMAEARVKRLIEALEKCAKPNTWHAPCLNCSEKIIEYGNYIARKALEDIGP